MNTNKVFFYAVGLLLIFLLLYLCVFHNGLSDNHEEWGCFGSYLGGVGGIILSCSIFYYTYTIDKDNKKSEKISQCLKLLHVVGESFALFERLHDLDKQSNNHDWFEQGTEQHILVSNEIEQLKTQIITNYTITQIMAKHLYDMEIPDVAPINQKEDYFKKVFQTIKKSHNDYFG